MSAGGRPGVELFTGAAGCAVFLESLTGDNAAALAREARQPYAP